MILSNILLELNIPFNEDIGMVRGLDYYTRTTFEISSSNLGKTLYEEDLIEQQKEINKMKNDPEIKKILDFFPGVSIHSITNINETIEEQKFIEENQKTKEI